MSICSCPDIRNFLGLEASKLQRESCFKGNDMPTAYPEGLRRIVDECDKIIGNVSYLSGNSWGARTIHEDECDTLRLFTCPYDAASWLHSVHDNVRGLDIPRGCNSDCTLTDDGCR